MRTPRVTALAAAPGEVIELPEREARHLALVLRRRPGDPVEVIAGDTLYRGAIVESEGGDGRPRVTVRVVERVERGPTLFPWTVAVSLVRGTDMDDAVRLASELGLEAMAPLVAERSQVRAARSGKPERWARIARESAKQCGRPRPLRIGDPLGIGEALALEGFERRWIADPGAPRAVEALAGGGAAVPSLFLVGPEGGFTPGELEEAERAGAVPLGFPTPVLRAPTAVLLIAALGLVLTDGTGPEDGEDGGKRVDGALDSR